MITKELFSGKYDGSGFEPVSPLDGYKYHPYELTDFQLTLDEEKGGVHFFTLAERRAEVIRIYGADTKVATSLPNGLPLLTGESVCGRFPIIGKIVLPNGDRVRIYRWKVGRRSVLRLVVNYSLRNFSLELLRSVPEDYWKPRAANEH